MFGRAISGYVFPPGDEINRSGCSLQFEPHHGPRSKLGTEKVGSLAQERQRCTLSGAGRHWAPGPAGHWARHEHHGIRDSEYLTEFEISCGGTAEIFGTTYCDGGSAARICFRVLEGLRLAAHSDPE